MLFVNMGISVFVDLSLLLICISNSVHHIYHWMSSGIADPGSENYDKVIAGKMGYFGWFWWTRTILYMVGWYWFTMKLRNNSIEADKLDVDVNNSAGILVNLGFKSPTLVQSFNASS